MTKHTFILIILTLTVSVCFSQQYGSFKDARDGKVYKTVKIGKQEWMAENLNVSTFRNGDTILEVKTYDELRYVSTRGQPAWCFYDNDAKNGDKYGKLYNWYAVNDPRGIAPKGYHIPSNDEWKDLLFSQKDDVMPYRDSRGNVRVAMIPGDRKLKSTRGWAAEGRETGNNCNGTNKSGFSALPAGYRCVLTFGEFGGLGTNGYWWGTRGEDKSEPGVLVATCERFYTSVGENWYYYPIRCLKD
jgi:uncharacterized protein (TIGR02145 family)